MKYINYFRLFWLVIFVSLSGCMHYYNSDSTYPLQLKIITKYNQNKKIIFSIRHKHSSLDRYMLKGIRIEKTSELCDSPAFRKPSTIWRFYPKTEKSVGSNPSIIYRGDLRNLNINTLYTSKVVLVKKDKKRLAHGNGVFVLLSSGRILSASQNFEKIQELCRKYK